MSNERNEFWNQRYCIDEYVYGEEPNQFFATQISELKPGGKIILEAFNPDQLQNNSGGPKDRSDPKYSNHIKRRGFS